MGKSENLPLDSVRADALNAFMIRPSLLVLAGMLLIVHSISGAEDRRERVLADRREVGADTTWIYNDLPRALAAAAETRKPMLVVFRCVP